MDTPRKVRGGQGLSDVIRVRIDSATRSRFKASAEADARTESSLARLLIKRHLDQLEDTA